MGAILSNAPSGIYQLQNFTWGLFEMLYPFVGDAPYFLRPGIQGEGVNVFERERETGMCARNGTLEFEPSFAHVARRHGFVVASEDLFRFFRVIDGEFVAEPADHHGGINERLFIDDPCEIPVSETG